MTHSLSAERLYGLLPALYRVRDGAHGEPLRALLAAFADELATLEENLDQLYDDQFIETCAEWVVPYIGDLIGYRVLQGEAPAVSAPRAEVANTIGYRRRKGTALMLEQLARDVTGWPACVVEFFERLATTQFMNHVRLHAPAIASVRDVAGLLHRGGAFDRVAHSVDVRRADRGGRYNIPNVGVFLWRLQPLRLRAVPLTPDPSDPSGRRCRLSPLGADLALYREPEREDDISQLAEPRHVPEPLRVRAMALGFEAWRAPGVPDAGDYGPNRSVVLFSSAGHAIPPDAICICDLSDVVDPLTQAVTGWNHEATVPPKTIAIDPERGRVVLGANLEGGPFSATFRYGSARAIGGGEYQRTPLGAEHALQLDVALGAPLQPHVDQIRTGGRLVLRDSQSYPAPAVLVVDAEAPSDGSEVVVAAANEARPLLTASAELELRIGPGGRLVLDGLVIRGGALRIVPDGSTEPRELVLRDCTLVPGRGLRPDGAPLLPGEPSLIIEHPFARVTLERCITGPIVAAASAEVILRECIVDACAPERVAFAASAAGGAGAKLSVHASTIVGKLHAEQVHLGENSIFFARLGSDPGETWRAPVIVERRQEGCLRYSYVPSGSVTPRRHRCVPDKARPNLQPHFTSLRYGDAAYGQLRALTDRVIRAGAEHGREMGVLYSLEQPQREENLRTRLEEYLRFGLRAGLHYAS